MFGLCPSSIDALIGSLSTGIHMRLHSSRAQRRRTISRSRERWSGLTRRCGRNRSATTPSVPILGEPGPSEHGIHQTTFSCGALSSGMCRVVIVVRDQPEQTSQEIRLVRKLAFLVGRPSTPNTRKLGSPVVDLLSNWVASSYESFVCRDTGGISS